MPLADIAAFLLASIILAFSPGPDNIFVLVTGLSQGFKTSFQFILGLCTGIILHTLLIVLGISTMISQSQYGLVALKYFAVIYLLWLAFKTFQHRKDVINMKAQEPVHNYFVRGFIMNTSNPKVLLFFLAFFPQFADLNTTGYQMRLMLLGALFIGVTLLVFSLIGWVGAKGSAKALNKPHYHVAINWLSITVFVAIAAILLFS